MPDDAVKLEGWKAIAAHLGVSTRTAQDYEKVFGLPILRGPREKSRVYAFVSELQSWKTRQTTPTKDASPDSVTVDALPSVPRRNLLRYGIVGGAFVSAFPAWELGRQVVGSLRPRRPLAFRIEGATLIVSGEGNAELWRHTFPIQISPAFIDMGAAFTPPCVFADVDDDGQIETLFRYWTSRTEIPHTLYCFDQIGNIKWQFLAGRRVVDDQGRDFSPPYWPNSLAVVRPRRGAAPVVLVSSNHHWSFPDQVAVLEGKSGKLLSEYWHRGHLTHVATADLDGSGETSVLLGGVNDAPEYKRATLVVFDRGRILGASVSPSGKSYFPAMGPGTERAVYFPRSPVNADQEFNRVVDLRPAPDRITVMVAEGINESGNPVVVYELSKTLVPLRVSFSGTFVQCYADLPRSIPLNRPSLDELGDILLRQVIVTGN